MRSHLTWSITFFRWGGLRVRLHMFFLLFAAFTLFLGWQDKTGDGLLVAAGSLLILLLSALLHELGHYYAALQLGGDGEEIVIGPHGGMASMHPPLEPRGECLMHLAGPLVNLIVCLVTGTVLAFYIGAGLWGMLHPLQPTGLLDGQPWLQAVKLTFWINWLLFLANLLPAFPFDGGRALRAALSMFWPDASPRRAALTVALLAKVAALGLLILAAVLLVQAPKSPATGPVPIWFALLLLAIFLYFSAKQEEDRADQVEVDDDVFGYDFSQGYTSLERSQHRSEAAGAVRRWLERRRKVRLQRQRELEADEERRVDEILSRLHQHGMESLSDEDRSLLKRVSDRYRERR